MRTYATPLLLLAALALRPPVAIAQSAQGSGPQATETFPLPAGLAVFEIRHQGPGPFSVRLLDSQGNVVERLADTRGPFDGSRALRIPQDGRYLFDVSATGSWSIRLREGSADGPSDLSATHAGQMAARGLGTMGWLATGLVGGVLAGPIGAGVNLALASGREVNVSARVLEGVRQRDPAYVEEFTHAFRGRVRANRRTSALVGGFTGTMLFAFLLVQVADWNIGAGGNPGGGGESPP